MLVIFVDGFAKGRIMPLDKSDIEYGKVTLLKPGIVNGKENKVDYRITMVDVFGHKIPVAHSFPVADSCFNYFLDPFRRDSIMEVVNNVRSYDSGRISDDA